MPNVPFVRARRALIAAACVTAGAVGWHVANAPAATALKVTESNFKVKPAGKSVAHGKVTFRVHNSSGIEHEMVVIRTSKDAAKLKVSGGRASEKGSVGEVEDIGGGKTKSVTLNLKKGHYVLICNVAGHYKAGMRTNFTVR